MKRAVQFLLFVTLTVALQGGEYNQTLSVGDPAPVWKDLPGTDDKPHSLEEFKDKEVVVVCFTCNSCEVASDYEQRLCEFSKTYAGPRSKVGLVAINVNRLPADQLPAMKRRAQERNYSFPYLYDESQKIARDYGATFTPEVFVLNRERRVVYMGGIDDHSDPKLVMNPWLQRAVEATLKGERPSKGETVAIGCRIRYDSGRRKRR